MKPDDDLVGGAGNDGRHVNDVAKDSVGLRSA
jgi:hypothetical protein